MLVIESLHQYVQGVHTRPWLCSSGLASSLQELLYAFLKECLHAQMSESLPQIVHSSQILKLMPHNGSFS